MTTIIFPVGDWATEGHAFLAEVLVDSNKSLQEVQKIHFQHNEFLGNICNDHRWNVVPLHYLVDGLMTKENSSEEEVRNYLQFIQPNIGIENYDEVKELNILAAYWGTTAPTVESIPPSETRWIIRTPEQLVGLWIALLQWFSPELELSIVSDALSQVHIKDKGYPVEPDGNLTYHGGDSTSDALKTPGYGIWNELSNYEFFYG